jgi:hypothetical protein
MNYRGSMDSLLITLRETEPQDKLERLQHQKNLFFRCNYMLKCYKCRIPGNLVSPTDEGGEIRLTCITKGCDGEPYFNTVKRELIEELEIGLGGFKPRKSLARDDVSSDGPYIQMYNSSPAPATPITTNQPMENSSMTTPSETSFPNLASSPVLVKQESNTATSSPLQEVTPVNKKETPAIPKMIIHYHTPKATHKEQTRALTKLPMKTSTLNETIESNLQLLLAPKPKGHDKRLNWAWKLYEKFQKDFECPQGHESNKLRAYNNSSTLTIRCSDCKKKYGFELIKSILLEKMQNVKTAIKSPIRSPKNTFPKERILDNSPTANKLRTPTREDYKKIPTLMSDERIEKLERIVENQSRTILYLREQVDKSVKLMDEVKSEINSLRNETKRTEEPRKEQRKAESTPTFKVPTTNKYSVLENIPEDNRTFSSKNSHRTFSNAPTTERTFKVYKPYSPEQLDKIENGQDPEKDEHVQTLVLNGIKSNKYGKLRALIQQKIGYPSHKIERINTIGKNAIFITLPVKEIREFKEKVALAYAGNDEVKVVDSDIMNPEFIKYRTFSDEKERAKLSAKHALNKLRWEHDQPGTRALKLYLSQMIKKAEKQKETGIYVKPKEFFLTRGRTLPSNPST